MSRIGSLIRCLFLAVAIGILLSSSPGHTQQIVDLGGPSTATAWRVSGNGQRAFGGESPDGQLTTYWDGSSGAPRPMFEDGTGSSGYGVSTDGNTVLFPYRNWWTARSVLWQSGALFEFPAELSGINGYLVTAMDRSGQLFLAIQNANFSRQLFLLRLTSVGAGGATFSHESIGIAPVQFDTAFLSPDGAVVFLIAKGGRVWRWTRISRSWTDLGWPSGWGTNPIETRSRMSLDGTTLLITGVERDFFTSQTRSRAAAWRSRDGGTWTHLAADVMQDVSADGISADGRVLVGRAGNSLFRWQDGLTTPLGSPPGAPEGARIVAWCDSTGSVIAGSWRLGDSPAGGFRRVGNGPFEVIPPLAGDLAFVPEDMSDDGTVLVGQSLPSGRAMRWSVVGGPVLLVGPVKTASTPSSESRNGSAIVGEVLDADGIPRGKLYRWSVETGMTPMEQPLLGDPPINVALTAWPTPMRGARIAMISDSGRFSAGDAFRFWGDPGARAIRWDGTAAMLLPLLPGTTGAHAAGISGNGQVIYGSCNRSDPVTGLILHQGFSWSEMAGVVNLGNLQGFPDVYPRDASADGSVIVGWCSPPPGSAKPGGRAFRWTRSGMVNLDPSSAFEDSEAIGCSRDGNVVVGLASSFAEGDQVFRWTRNANNSGGTIQFLENPPGFFEVKPLMIDDTGNVVIARCEQYRPDVGFVSMKLVRWQGLSAPVDLSPMTEITGLTADGAVVFGTVQAADPAQVSVPHVWTASTG
ncbi:MAG: hypothetical protein ACKPGI_19655, partial [Verrucomicrobiota bacterium]